MLDEQARQRANSQVSFDAQKKARRFSGNSSSKPRSGTNYSGYAGNQMNASGYGQGTPGGYGQ